MKSSGDTEAKLQSLEQDIERWNDILSQLPAENKERSLIEAKLSDWRQKRQHLASLFVAELKQSRKRSRHR